MKKICVVFSLSVIMGVASYGASSSLQVKRLLCENLSQPLGIDNLTPHFSWQIASQVAGARQSDYELQVASDSAALERGEADLWSTGRVAGADQVMVPYAGTALLQRQLCYWRVRVWDGDGHPSAWSAIARFSIGLLCGVSGDYIGMNTRDGDARAPLLRRKKVLSQSLGGSDSFS